jgi:hypothetical protein
MITKNYRKKIVTDMRTKMCVDPGGNGAILNVGGEGGPARLAGEEVSSRYQTAETVRHSQDDRRQRRQARHGIKAPLCTEYVSLYVLTCCILNDCSHERCFTCLSVSGEKIIWQ